MHDGAERRQQRRLLFRVEFPREIFQGPHLVLDDQPFYEPLHCTSISKLEVTMARASKVNPDGYVHTRDAKNISVCVIRPACGRAPRRRCCGRWARPRHELPRCWSGPGAVMRLMGDRVGPQGRVTGDAAVHYLPLADMANMLIGVYDGLYAVGAELGLADPLRASAFRKDMAEAGADGRLYCLTPVLIAAWKRMG